MEQTLNAKVNVNKQYWLLKIMTLFRYYGDCFFYGYFYLFLVSKGLTESKIGMITALTPLVTLLCNPLWNILSKNANTNRTIMRIITVIEGACIILFTRCTTVEMIAILTCVVALIGSPFYNLLDGYSGTFAKAYDKDYTKIRYMGTTGYILSSLTAAGVLYLTKDNYDVLLYIGGAIFILTTIFFFFLRPIELSMLSEGKEEVKRDYKAILKNKTFWVYMLVYFLVVSVSSAADSFISVYFTKYQQVSSSVWSIIYSGILVSELLMMLLLTKLKKANINLLWLIVGATYTLRSLGIFLNFPLPLIIALVLLRGVSYGMILHSHIRALEQICGISNVTAGLFVVAIGTSVVQCLSNFFFGQLIEQVGYPIFYGVVSGISFIGFIINLIYQVTHKFSYPKYQN